MNSGTTSAALETSCRSRRLAAATALFMTFLCSCAALHMQPAVGVSPIVRVGIVTNADEISFQPSGTMHIVASSGAANYKARQKDVWKIRIPPGSVSPAKLRLQMETAYNRTDAKKAAQRYEAAGILVNIIESDDQLALGNNVIAGKLRYLVCSRQEFSSSAEAEAYRSANPQLTNARIVPVERSASGTMILVSPKGEELALRDVVRLSGPRFTIHSVKVGEGFHWSRQESRSYRGELEFRLSADGKLTAVNVLPLEDYLMGVVPGEMAPDFPKEALKAQAIAARTFFLYNFGRVHQNDPFDVCADVHCQVFVGDRDLKERVIEAVTETRGLVLTVNGELCTTPFSAVCGGHTENSENVWSGGPFSHLRGSFDHDQRQILAQKFDLSNEDNVRLWIESRADVFCNTEKSGSPSYAAYAEKYFRWQERFTRMEMEEQIRRFTGRTFGSLVDLQPVSRGVSGRLIELRIVGTADTFSISKELNIRKALSPKTLYSACIVIDKIGGGQLPEAFVIKGAGWGHGVGMCQIGAAMMAERGRPAEEILRFYYPNVQIQELY
ncbi:MAG: SpoIID/LytB domain-containing protein [candidate division KSB1 bacterium]|nr:SpoIID/LytB domain-containing protein [candidate division KSB1 bacterium]